MLVFGAHRGTLRRVFLFLSPLLLQLRRIHLKVFSCAHLFFPCAQVRLLLECGADPKAILAQGVTPLYTAARNGHAATLDLLLKSGAVVNARAEDGSTALVKAAQKGHLDALQVRIFGLFFIYLKVFRLLVSFVLSLCVCVFFF